MINWALISNPWNWIIVLLMVMIGGFAAEALIEYYTTNNA